MKRRIPIVLLLVALAAGVIYYQSIRPPREIVLSGVVTTDEVIVSPQILGRLEKLLVREGDHVTNGQLLAVIQAQEWKADMAFAADSELQSSAQVTQAEANLKFQEAQTSNQIAQAEANLAAVQAQEAEARANLENASLSFKRTEGLFKQGVESGSANDQARTSQDAAQARVDSLHKQVQAADSAVALAKANAEQTASRRAALDAGIHQRAAMVAQRDKAQVHLDHTELRAPIAGVVDTRTALPGEVVNPGQAVLTLIDQDNLWIRADVEETYIEKIKLEDKINVRLPSGAIREGTVFFRGVDAGYATQRDVSRTKRDIKTFEIRLRCDNQDRSLAVGMTAHVTVRLAGH